MFAANTSRVRLANDDDSDAIRGLAERNSHRPLAGRMLIEEIDGVEAAALSLTNRRVLADSSPRAMRSPHQPRGGATALPRSSDHGDQGAGPVSALRGDVQFLLRSETAAWGRNGLRGSSARQSEVTGQRVGHPSARWSVGRNGRPCLEWSAVLGFESD